MYKVVFCFQNPYHSIWTRINLILEEHVELNHGGGETRGGGGSGHAVQTGRDSTAERAEDEIYGR